MAVVSVLEPAAHYRGRDTGTSGEGYGREQEIELDGSLGGGQGIAAQGLLTAFLSRGGSLSPPSASSLPVLYSWPVV